MSLVWEPKPTEPPDALEQLIQGRAVMFARVISRLDGQEFYGPVPKPIASAAAHKVRRRIIVDLCRAIWFLGWIVAALALGWLTGPWDEVILGVMVVLAGVNLTSGIAAWAHPGWMVGEQVRKWVEEGIIQPEALGEKWPDCWKP